MRRKNDDKRVLRAGNGRNNKRRRSSPINRRTPNNFFAKKNKTQSNYRSKKRNKKKRSGKTVILMILVLIAFVVGAGMGILLSFDDGSGDNATHIKNVTVEMTTHLNETNDVYFDEADDVDYNENQTSEILGVEDNPYYYDDGLSY